MKGCAIAAAVVVALLIGMLVFLARIPTVRSMVICRENMSTVYEAMNRYEKVNNKYPAKLEDLKDYLKSINSLRCPLDKSEGNDPSYIYSIPTSDSDNKFVVLECDRHHLVPNAPNSKLRLLKSGNFEIINPSSNEIKKKLESNQKK